MISSLRTTVFLGTLWTVALRWIARLIGLVSVAILARVLAPSDFGLVAMAMLVVGFVEAWMAFGVDTALVQNPVADRADYDTAWTIRLIQGVSIASLAVLVSPVAAAYFEEPRLGLLLPVLALTPIISASSNIGVVMFRKELRFQPDFWMHTIAKLVTFPIAITAAFAIGNYWALAIGILGASLVNCIVSYIAHPYRPRLSLAKWRELWSFSQWLLVLNLIGYAERKSDEILVGGHTSATEMGFYSFASELGQLPSAEVAAPVNRVLFPAFAKLQDQPQRLAAAYANALAMVTTTSIPIGIGLACIATEAVDLLLGDRWSASAPLLAVLAVGGTVRSVSSSAGYVLLALGRPKLDAIIASCTLVAFLAAAALALTTGQGIVGIALAKLSATFVSLFVAWGFLLWLTEVTVPLIAGSVVRPLLATTAMALILMHIPSIGLGTLADLALKGAIGAVSYGAVLLTLWRIAGCPHGPERLGIDLVKNLKLLK